MSVERIATDIKCLYCQSLKMVDSFTLSKSLLFKLFENKDYFCCKIGLSGLMRVFFSKLQNNYTFCTINSYQLLKGAGS